ncbi:MAG TPA: hypothetical protein VJ010_02595, partial [Actinomycetota bacterium]|nr:hypothetical protein [Actinomycetota bacterium]
NYGDLASTYPAPESIDELKKRIEELETALHARRKEIPDANDVIEAARGASEQMNKERPLKGVVVALLVRVANGVKAAVDLAAQVAPLVQAANKLLG